LNSNKKGGTYLFRQPVSKSGQDCHPLTTPKCGDRCSLFLTDRL